MQESNSTPGKDQSQAIVPVVETFTSLHMTLSPAQKTAAEKATTSYMIKCKIPFTTPGLRAATHVILGDALPRGISAEGKTDLSPNDNINKLIQKGLTSRSEAVKKAQAIIWETASMRQRDPNPFVGDYAIPAEIFVKAEKETQKQKVAVASSITNADTLVRLKEERKDALPEIAGAVLELLPRDLFPDATIAMFPTPAEQSAILRNVITSMIFRNNPNPIITISEIKQFTEQDVAYSQMVVDTLSDSLTAASHLPQAIIKSYLSDLAHQVIDEFTQARNIEADGRVFENPAGRDRLYNEFKTKLLLLHPALEERPLILDPEKHTAGDYSLWGETTSVVINGFRIPKPDILAKAQRLQGAQGKGTQRFEEAMRQWKAYDNLVLRQKKQTDDLSKQIEKLDSQLEELQDPSDIPDLQLYYIKAAHPSLYDEYRHSLFQIRDNQRIIATIQKRYRIHDYLLEVKRENGGQFPPTFSLPEDEEDVELADKKLSGLKGALSLARYKAQDVFSKDIFSVHLKTSVREKLFDFEKMDPQVIDAIKRELSEQDSRFKAYSGDLIVHENDDITLKDVRDHIEATIEQISEMDTFLRNQPDSKGGMDRVELSKLENYRWFKKELLPVFEKYPPETLGIPRDFYLYSLNKRLTSLERLIYCQKKYDYYMSHKEPTQINAKTAEKIIKIQEIHVPQPDDIVWDNAAVNLPQISFPLFTLNDLGAIHFPQEVSSKAAFLTIVNREQEGLRSPIRHIRQLFFKQRALDNLISIINSPLFPDDDLLDGLTGDEIIGAFRVRTQYLRSSIIDFETVQRQHEKVKRAMETLAFENYKRNLTYRKSKLEKQLTEEQSQTPESDFLIAMQVLRLAIPEDFAA